MKKMWIIDLGHRNYEQCLALQHRVHQARKGDLVPDCLLLVEHPHVFTLGRRGKKENILVPEQALRERSIPLVEIERGGDVTYHGPGQLVGYPIVSFRGGSKGVADFVGRLEEVMIRILGDFGITAGRNEINRGVWVGEEKIGFVGIAVRAGISLHGFALNVAPDLTFFEMIHPCGLSGVSVTSMEVLCGRDVSFEDVKKAARTHFAEVLGVVLESVSMEAIQKIDPGCEMRDPG